MSKPSVDEDRAWSARVLHRPGSAPRLVYVAGFILVAYGLVSAVAGHIRQELGELRVTCKPKPNFIKLFAALG